MKGFVAVRRFSLFKFKICVTKKKKKQCIGFLLHTDIAKKFEVYVQETGKCLGGKLWAKWVFVQ